MKFAHKLFEIARRPSSNPNPRAVDKYFNKIMKEAKKQAEAGNLNHKFVFKSSVAMIKVPLGKRLYEEGFEVETRHFPSIGDFDVLIGWDKKKLREPVHKYLP